MKPTRFPLYTDKKLSVRFWRIRIAKVPFSFRFVRASSYIRLGRVFFHTGESYSVKSIVLGMLGK